MSIQNGKKKRNQLIIYLKLCFQSNKYLILIPYILSMIYLFIYMIKSWDNCNKKNILRYIVFEVMIRK